MKIVIALLVLSMSAATAAGQPPARPPVVVVATVPDLAEIARLVGGDRVEVTSLVQGPQDPHFLEARPSFIRDAGRADILLHVGMELEIGFLSLVVTESRNGRIQPGAPGYVDASAGIERLEVPSGVVDRSRGDVHAQGNPHYLLDPVNVKIVAATIRDALAVADPAAAEIFLRNQEAIGRRIDVAMFGEEILASMKGSVLAELQVQGRLREVLERRGLLGSLGGFARDLLPAAGKSVAVYHAGGLTYLLHRFGIRMAAALESKPGIPPSPRHLATTIKTLADGHVTAVFHAVHNDRTIPRNVAQKIGGQAFVYAHQVGALPGAADLFALHAYNVTQLRTALLGGP